MAQNGMECCFTSVSHVFWDLLTCSRIVLFVYPRIRRQNTGSVHTPVVAWGLACFVLFLHHAESCLCCAEPREEATGWITTAQEAVAQLFNSEVLFAGFCVRSLSQSRRCRSGVVHSALDRVKVKSVKFRLPEAKLPIVDTPQFFKNIFASGSTGKDGADNGDHARGSSGEEVRNRKRV
ncbi:hypothetical protein EDC04DRAFT_2808246 [Pisolithus marmoratus]|nr:hypothetical protein EDC04DRAFT_2808246 [Pisolithus marmoratus]